MDTTTKAYLAGLFDGEGCIQIAGSYIKRLRRKNIMLGVKIAMQSRASVEVFAKVAGRKPLKHGEYGGTWECTIWQEKARDFLVEILPYLVVKKTQAEFAIWFYNAAFAHRPVGAVKLTGEELLFRELCSKIMSLLNHRDSMAFQGKSGEFSEKLNPLMSNVMDMLTLSQASEGTGSEEGATTREMSPNNNSPHELPTLLH